MRKNITIFALLLMLCAACFMVGCGETKSYTITFANYDGTQLQSTSVKEGEIPQYKGATPAKQSDDEYEYEFVGWDNEIVSATKNATYTAQFNAFKLNDYQSGDGGQSNPYVISTPHQLKFFANNVNANKKYANTYFVLDADINLNNEEWTPIGTGDKHYFAGFFDGDNHKVFGFKITEYAGYCGLFGYSRATVKNLGAEDFIINVSAAKSGVAVYAGGLIGYGYSGAISNCYATGSVSTATLTGAISSAYSGGLAGYIHTGATLTDCHATGNASVSAYWAGAGGLVAINRGAISGCYATGNVTSDSFGDSSSGAFAGGLVDENIGTITNCYATGNVSATASISGIYAYAGGLVDYNNGTITNSYATGDVSAEVNSDSDTNCYAFAGGLAGYNNGVTTSCYATGNISVSALGSSPNAYVDGLAGYKTDVTITNCYRYENQVFYRKQGENEYDTATNDYGTPCTLTELNSKSFYTDALEWDEEVWDFSDLDFEGGKFPTLKEINNLEQEED